MANVNNNGNLIGRLQSDPKILDNTGGSKTVLLTLIVEENFLRAGETERQANVIGLKTLIPAKANGVGSWARVHKGDLIAVATYLEAKPYQKDGKTVYPAPTVRVDGYPEFLEPKNVTEARAAKHAAKAAQAEIEAAQTPAGTGEGQDQAAQIAALQAQIAMLGGEAEPAVDASENPFNA